MLSPLHHCTRISLNSTAFTWFGWIAAQNVPGMFWELGGLKKSWPMTIMPIAGALIALSASMLILEDILVLTGRRKGRMVEASGTDLI